MKPPSERDFTDETVPRVSTWFMPGGPKGTSDVEERRGYRVRTRGDTAAARERLGVEPRRIPREFVCPVHGRFTLEVDEQTDEVACPCEADLDLSGCSVAEGVEISNCVGRCGRTAPWSPSAVGQGKSSGEVSC